jgi:imidazolonepropionase-like amidohydrolase
MSPVSQKKALQVWAGTDNAYKLARKYKIKTAWGADILFDPGAATRHGTDLSVMVKWYTPAEMLKMATADNGELMALSGVMNPYPGKLGVIKPGAFADLLLVDGDPIANIKLRRGPGEELHRDHEGWENLQKHHQIMRPYPRGIRSHLRSSSAHAQQKSWSRF